MVSRPVVVSIGFDAQLIHYDFWNLSKLAISTHYTTITTHCIKLILLFFTANLFKFSLHREAHCYIYIYTHTLLCILLSTPEV